MVLISWMAKLNVERLITNILFLRSRDKIQTQTRLILGLVLIFLPALHVTA